MDWRRLPWVSVIFRNDVGTTVRKYSNAKPKRVKRKDRSQLVSISWLRAVLYFLFKSKADHDEGGQSSSRSTLNSLAALLMRIPADDILRDIVIVVGCVSQPLDESLIFLEFSRIIVHGRTSFLLYLAGDATTKPNILYHEYQGRSSFLEGARPCGGRFLFFWFFDLEV